METGYTVNESKYISLMEDGFMQIETALEVPVQKQSKFVPEDSDGKFENSDIGMTNPTAIN